LAQRGFLKRHPYREHTVPYDPAGIIINEGFCTVYLPFYNLKKYPTKMGVEKHTLRE